MCWLSVHSIRRLQWSYHKCTNFIHIFQRSAIECSAQNSDSSKNTPIPVQGRLGISEQNAEGQSYPQYLATVRSQVSCAKEIHDLLRECASRLGTSQMAMTNIAPGAGPPGTMNPMGPGPGPGPGPVPGQQPPQGQGMHPMAPMNPMQMGKMGQPWGWAAGTLAGWYWTAFLHNNNA